ncbi:DNA mismatch repair endonuclease MutL [Candidatus Hamiltonella defensa]|uniref:DNA mismatch repair endonuclease MutL n=1 Tax=Candidatus Williamhamiltonella defendens TaxID=138072 RepID=UPI000C1F3704|nr:DNA mismatch repair endonuclease MutL [Candidatus Hamiltonella defensa]ATW32836.1 DNA mismatch repair protein MutL [Candidatus Hamiltonella defensa]
MPIKILPTELANQIAAGEVVERPASVVKELVENSLDAGATKMEIDIHRGGIEQIQICDNGCGISKEDLPLALARHATDKIASLEDLQSILSMGFRGEALASISSVSRLQLTSRPAEQEDAWQAYTEGRDMNVTIKPASHPVGSTIEVLNLFYNTPARRKFLRTEKTEWQYIDEVVRRLALSRFDVSISLSHNGKLLRQYVRVQSGSQRERRLLRLCGAPFLKQALALSFDHSGLSLKGWIAEANGPKMNEIQYFFINRRIIRDRVINHAVRQAYEAISTGPKNPSYVLYLDIDPRQIDVNVHPTKQEVRFHQTRLVHDFIYHAITNALSHSACSSSDSSADIEQNDSVVKESPKICKENRASAGRNTYVEPDIITKQTDEASLSFHDTSRTEHKETSLKKDILGEVNEHYFWRVLSIVSSCYALIEYGNNIALLSLPEADRLLKKVGLTPPSEKSLIQPLLIPVKFTLEKAEMMACERHQHLLTLIGIELVIEKDTAGLRGISLALRAHNMQKLIPKLLLYLSAHDPLLLENFADWVASQLQSLPHEWTVSQAVQLLTDFERCCPEFIKAPSEKLLQCIDIQPALARLTH